MNLVILATVALSAAALCPSRSLARRATTRRLAAGGDGENEPSLAARAAWVGAEVFGKVASAVRADDAPPAAAAAALVAPASREEARARLRADYERAYFVAGVMDEGLYAADCVFADDIAAFSGRERFVANLANLGALVSEFDVRLLGAAGDGGDDALVEGADDRARWTLTGRVLVKLRLRLPWKPVLAWVWKVTHAFEEREPSAAEPRARVVCVDHRESWEISTLAGVAQVFRPGPEAPLTKQL